MLRNHLYVNLVTLVVSESEVLHLKSKMQGSAEILYFLFGDFEESDAESVFFCGVIKSCITVGALLETF